MEICGEVSIGCSTLDLPSELPQTEESLAGTWLLGHWAVGQAGQKEAGSSGCSQGTPGHPLPQPGLPEIFAGGGGFVGDWGSPSPGEDQAR